MLPVGLGVALALFGDLTLFAVLVTQLDGLGLDLAQAGILLSVHRLVRIPFNPLAGWLQDRAGRRVPFLIGLALAVASTAAYGLVHGFWAFFLARVAWGAAWSLINVGGIAMALDLSDETSRGRLSGLYTTWVWIGYAIGPVIGSLLTDSLGFSRSMLICAGCTAAGLGAALWLLPETHRSRPIPAGPDVKTVPTRSPWPWKSMFIFGANQFAMDGIVLSTITLLITVRLGAQVGLGGAVLGAATFGGLIMSARAALAALTSTLIGRLSDRGAGRGGRSARSAVIAGGLCLGLAGFALLAVSRSLAGILVGVLCGAPSASILLVSLPAQVGDETPAPQRGLALGKLAAAGDVGSTLGPFLALSLAPLTGLAPIYLLCAGLFTAGFFIIGGPGLWLRRPIPQAAAGEDL